MKVNKPSKLDVAKLIKRGMEEAEAQGKDMEVREIIEKVSTAYVFASSVDDIIRKYDLPKRETSRFFQEAFSAHMDAIKEATQDLMRDFKKDLNERPEHYKRVDKDVADTKSGNWFTK